MINRANEGNSDALKSYKKLVGRGMVTAGIISAAMGIILLVTLVFEMMK